MEFKAIIQTLMESRGLRQADLCRMTNIPSSLMSEYVSGKKSPALNNAIAISEALNVSLDELTGRADLHTSILSAREEELIRKYRSLDERGRDTIDLAVDAQCDLIKGKLNGSSTETSAS